ncbi:MAG: PKD domain-containing protein [Bacteroidetes bacterium]|nr:PKD domain-containing protein [Bacteroidota bacterium]
MKNSFLQTKNCLQKFFVLSLLTFGFLPANAQLSGTYTIDPSKSASSTNYTSFTDAVGDLMTGSRSSGTANGPGVKAAVVFHIADGTYDETVELDSLLGTTKTNTITFESASGDSSKVILRDTLGNFTVHLMGTDYVTFQKMTIYHDITGGDAIWLEGMADSNRFFNNRIIGCSSILYSFPYPCVVRIGGMTTSTYSADSANVFFNNYIQGGYYGFYLYNIYSRTKLHARGNVINHNIIVGSNLMGIYAYYQYAFTISNNKIIRDRDGYGIYNFYGNNATTKTTYFNKIYNNFISQSNANTTTYGIYTYYNDYTYYYNNNVLISGTNASSYAANFYGSTTNKFVHLRNNSFVNLATGTAIYISASAATVATSNYNNLYGNGTYLGYHAGTNCATLAAWKTASKKDSSSLNVNPGYVSNSDLHITNAQLNGKGKYSKLTALDIDGETRNLTKPDIGADEIEPHTTDAGVYSLDSPAFTGCGGAQNIYTTISNYGLGTLTSFSVNWSVNGTAQTAYTYSGSLTIGKSVQVKLGSYSFATGSSYALKIYTSSPNGLSGDSVPTNDTLTKTLNTNGLTGTYSIGTSGTYTTFTAAVADMVSKGICGAITINVDDNTYTESVKIDAIKGTSATNTITFQSKNGDSTKVILDWALTSSSGANNYALQLNGCSHIIFKKMTLQRSTGGRYGNVIEITGSAAYNTITNCEIKAEAYGAGSYAYLVYSQTSGDSFNAFNNNLFYNSYYGVNYGNSGVYETGNSFTNNTFDTIYYYGCYIGYQNQFNFLGNKVSGITANYGYALYFNYARGGSKYIGNKITTTAGTYGMNCYYFNSVGGKDTNYVANNFISCTGTYINSTYGIYCYGSDYVNFLYNNVNLYSSGAAATYYTYYGYNATAAKSILVYNNNFVNTQSAYAIYSNKNITDADNNNYYVASGALGAWNAATISNLAAWQTATSFDANSYSVNPNFTSNTDLHVGNAKLNGTAQVFGRITTDIDGETRNATKPDIGADEFNPPMNDAGVSAIDSPQTSSCGGTQNVYATVTNYGTGTLSSFTVNWSVNGTAQTAVSLSSLSIASGNTTMVKLGSYSFTKGSTYNIIAYTSAPNGLTKDSTPSNDSSNSSISTNAMSGTYTIGSSGTYATFTATVADLITNGVCGAVVIRVDNGIYSEQVEITAIPGASAINTITFTSDKGDSSKVILEYGSGTYPDYHVLKLNGCSHVIFNQMTIEKSAASYQYCVYVLGNADYNKFTNCIIHGAGTSANTYVLYSVAGVNNYNTFYNNRIEKGYYNIYWSCNSGSATGNSFIHNSIDTFTNYGAYLGLQNNLIFSKNIIKNNIGTTGYGIYANYVSDGSIFSGNKVYTTNSSAVYFNYCQATKDSIYVVNNFFSGTSSNNGIAYFYYCNLVNLYYNSIYHMSGGSSTYNAYFASSTTATTSFRSINNVFVNMNTSGYNIYSTRGITTTDYNNYYFKTTNMGYWNTTICKTIAAWKTASSQDKNCRNIDPKFKSASDLHILNTSLDGLGKNIGTVLTDIDGQTRSTSAPDMGADEIFPSPYDAGIISIDSPSKGFCPGTRDVYATIQNYGTASLTSVSVNWSVNGTAQTSIAYTTTIVAGGSAQVKLGSYSFTGTGTFNIKVYTTSPNGTTDPDNTNDTATTIVGGGIGGTYTIGGTTPDYATFTAAIADLTLRGVCSSVTFNVRDGYYNEQLTLGKINNASATKTITFQSSSLDSTKVILDYGNTGTSTNNFTLYLKGSVYTTFNKITISRTQSATTASYARVIQVDGKSCYNTFNNCLLYGIPVTSSFANYTEVISSAADVDSFNTFYNNIIRNGYYSIYWYGTSQTVLENGSKFIHNTIDSSIAGCLFYYQNNMVFDKNTMVDITNAAMYGYYLYGALKITNNKIVTGGGMRLYYCDGKKDSINIYNNMMSNSGVGYTLYTYYMVKANIYYNSFLYDGGSTSYYTVYMVHSSATTANTRFYNNIVDHNAGGYPMYITTAITNINNNDYYTTGNMGYWNGTAYATFGSWKTATGQDANSLFTDPKFFAYDDLHTTNGLFNGKAKSIATIKSDIDGDVRGATSDIGADEFTPPANDVGVDSILSPSANACGDSNTTFTIRVANFGSSSQSNIPLTLVINGSTVATGKLVGPLAAAKDSAYTFSYKRNTFAGATLTVVAYTSLSTDAFSGNDSITRSLTFTTPAIIKNSKGVVSCKAGIYKLTAAAISTLDTIYWYNNAGNYLAQGDTFTTPYLTAPTNYYAEAAPTMLHAGVLTSTGAGTPTLSTTVNRGLTFDALNDFYLDTVTTYVRGTGNVVINLYDASATLVNSISTSVIGSTTTTPKLIKIPVGFFITAGTDYYINAKGSTITSMYTSPTAKYPYTKSNLVSITRNTISTTSTVYFFFYDWQISTHHGCPSAKKLVKADVGGLKATFNFTASCATKKVSFTDASTIGGGTITSRKWDFGDGAKDTAKNPTHTYSSSGPFTVKLIITTSGGCTDTFTKAVSFGSTPKAAFTATDECLTKANQFVDNTSFGSSYTRIWKFGDGKTDTAKTSNHTYATAGTYTATLLTIAAGGCADSTQKTVSVFDNPKVAFGVSAKCLSKPVDFTDSTITNSNPAKYSWAFGDGNSDTIPSPSHTYGLSANYTTTLSVTNSHGCSANLSKTFKLDDDPDASFGYTSSSAVDYTFNPHTTGYTSYQWDFGDGNTSNTQSPSHTFSSGGDHTVKLIVDNGKGCTAIDSQIVTITGIVQAGNNFSVAIFPNPFKESTHITYRLNQPNKVRISITNMLGVILTTLTNTTQPVGEHSVNFTAPAAGVYFVKMEVGNEVIIKRIVMVK